MPTWSLQLSLCQLRLEEGKWASDYGKVLPTGNPDPRVHASSLGTGVLSTGVSSSSVKVLWHEGHMLVGTPYHPQALHVHTPQMSD